MLKEKARILVVEDEKDIRELMVLRLQRENYQVEEAPDGEAALKKLGQEQYQLVILDWMMPGANGLDLARMIRQGRSGFPSSDRTPVLMVTARVEPADIVLGLEAGADDYVTKPFEIPVFLARVRALIRRASYTPSEREAEEQETLILGDLRIEAAAHRVLCANEPITLTHSEFKLLVALAKSRGRVLTRAHLIDLVQGSAVNVVDRTIDTHVFGLRKKLGRCGEIIETVRGVGYRVRDF